MTDAQIYDDLSVASPRPYAAPRCTAATRSSARRGCADNAVAECAPYGRDRVHRVHRDESCQRAAAVAVGAHALGFARDLRERDIEKITIARGITRDELRCSVRVRIRRTAVRCRPARAARRAANHDRPPQPRADRGGRHGDRRGAARLRLCCRDRGNPVAGGEGWGPARPERGEKNHRQPREARLAGSHVADGPDGDEAVRQLHVHAHGERLGDRDGAGALAQPDGPLLRESASRR